MKIALYVPSWPPGKTASGIVTYASQMVPALRNLGHEVFVVTPGKADDDPRTIDLNAFAHAPSIWARTVEQLVPGTVAWRGTALAIRSTVRHLMHVHGVEVFEMEETLGLNNPLSRRQLLPVVMRLHGPWFLTGAPQDSETRDSRSSLRRQRLEGIGIQNASLVSAPTAEILRAVRSRYCLQLANSCVIPNTLKSADDQNRWRFESCDPNNILFVGRFDRQKGGDLVLRVFAELASIYPHLTLTFVGPDSGIKGPDNNLNFFQSFVQLIIPEWCRSRIRYYGQLPHSGIMSHRRKSFLTLVASQYETMPYAVLEAMSLGCPIVATHVGGIPEMIRDRENGLLVPPQNPKKMADACSALLNDPTLAASLGRQSWYDCRDFYNPTKVAEYTAHAYGNAINNFKSHVKTASNT
jgi:glycosyltransferase involved in cell wall biosynthesis